MCVSVYECSKGAKGHQPATHRSWAALGAHALPIFVFIWFKFLVASVDKCERSELAPDGTRVPSESAQADRSFAGTSGRLASIISERGVPRVVTAGNPGNGWFRETYWPGLIGAARFRGFWSHVPGLHVVTIQFAAAGCRIAGFLFNITIFISFNFCFF